MGADTVLLTADPDRIAQMSCNPAIGGLAKGQLVREIDALGGEMARVADRTGIQFRMLNKGKGPAVWSPRAQSDREHYRREMTATVASQERLRVEIGSAVEVIARDGEVAGVMAASGDVIEARSVILTPGTFLNGVMHVGTERARGGRHGEEACAGLTESLQRLGLACGRLKTGTSPRVRAGSVDFAAMERQDGDDPPRPFSHFTGPLQIEQMPCHVTRSNSLTAEAVRRNLERSPLYSGRIRGVGPRYCPSFEDKVVRFPDRESHQIIVEPEGRQAALVYLNGLSTSLPADVQLDMVRSLEGLHEAEIAVPGYAVEYDFVFPTQLEPSLECKVCKGLFLAGQINGTSGYEEAAAQGLIAGVNAVRGLQGAPPLVLGRHEAYVGVLVDDLVTKGTREPYRMFTSMAEYRLLLRQDNADERLARYGRELGLLSEEEYGSVRSRQAAVASELGRLRSSRATAPPTHQPDAPGARAEIASPSLSEGPKITLETLLSRPHITYDDLAEVDPASSEVPQWVRELVQIRVKYAGYIKRQERDVERFKRLERMLIPAGLWEERLMGLSLEAGEKLGRLRPRSLGQAGRIPGVTPADVSVLHLHLERFLRSKAASGGRPREGSGGSGDIADDGE
jgi:tRNA uridine 5-carboxymethylaminomethyl modification enzyme